MANKKAVVTKRLWLKQETEKARLFWLGNPVDIPPKLWIPRSVCPYVRKELRNGLEPWQPCTVEIEEWWWNENAPKGEQKQFKLDMTEPGAGSQESKMANKNK